MKNQFITISLTILVSITCFSFINAQSVFSDVTKTFKGHRTSVNEVEFSKDGSELYTCGGNNQIIVFETKSGDILRSSDPRGNGKPISRVSLSLNDSLLAWSAFNGDRINICDPNSFENIIEITGFISIDDIAFSPRYNNIAIVAQVGASKQVVSTYDAETGLLYVNYFTQEDQTLPVSVDFSSDGELIACGMCNANQGIRIWDFNSGELVKSITAPDDINMVKFSPDNLYVAGACGDNNVYIWSILTGELVHTLKGLENMVMTIDFSPDGKAISAAGFDNSCTFKTWSTETGELFQTMGERGPTILCVRYHPESIALAVSYTTYGDLFEVSTVNLFYLEEFADEIEWAKIESSKCDLIIEFPLEPQISSKSDEYYEYYDFKLQQSGKSYHVRATKYLYDISDSKRLAAVNKSKQKFDNSKSDVQNIEYSLGSHPSYEKIGFVNKLRYHQRVVFVDNVMFTIMYVDYEDDVNSEETRYFDSFSIK